MWKSIKELREDTCTGSDSLFRKNCQHFPGKNRSIVFERYSQFLAGLAVGVMFYRHNDWQTAIGRQNPGYMGRGRGRVKNGDFF